MELKPSALWQHFKKTYQEQRMPHAIVLVGALQTELLQLARDILATLLCKGAAPHPCRRCQSCELIALQTHPDLLEIMADKPHGAIKIDQIRPLQELVYIAPQLANKRGIIIHTADAMNMASQNALLKILEEPPANTYFLLIAEHISTISATIQSRCQRWCMPETTADTRAAELQKLTENVTTFLDGKLSAHKMAADWAEYELHDTIWLFYLLNANMISSYFANLDSQSHALAKRIGLFCLFRQLDALHSIRKHLRQKIQVNTLLVLETFLLGYKEQNDVN